MSQQTTPDQNATLVATFIDVVWRQGRLDQLDHFWTADCVNHADAGPANRGLPALRRYHEVFKGQLAAFQSPEIEILQQVAQGDRVATQMVTRAHHRPTGRTVSLATIRIDRLHEGRIAEHWSVADMAGLMQQIS